MQKFSFAGNPITMTLGFDQLVKHCAWVGGSNYACVLIPSQINLFLSYCRGSRSSGCQFRFPLSMWGGGDLTPFTLFAPLSPLSPITILEERTREILNKFTSLSHFSTTTSYLKWNFRHLGLLSLLLRSILRGVRELQCRVGGHLFLCTPQKTLCPP